MYSKSKPAQTAAAATALGTYAHTSALVLTCYGNGYAYLRPEDDEPRYWITDKGRRALREAELFGTQVDADG